jgi:hypothetical protein
VVNPKSTQANLDAAHMGDLQSTVLSSWCHRYFSGCRFRSEV